MKTELKELSTTKRELRIDIQWEEIEADYDLFLKKFRNKVQIPGFRKGKVPVGMVERQYGSQIEFDFINERFYDFYVKALQDVKLNPVSDPNVTDLHFHKGEHLHLLMEIEILPKLELPDYKKGFKVEQPVYTLDKKDIEDQIQELLKKHASLENKEGVAAAGDHLEAEIYESDEKGNPVGESKPETTTLVIGEPPITDDKAETLTGIQKEETRMLVFKAENEKDDDRYYSVKALNIQKLLLPELNDEFVQTVDPELETVAQLREKIKSDLENYFTKESEKILSGNIREYFVNELSDYELPESIIENYLNDLYEEEKKNLNISKEQFFNQRREMAVKTLKWMMAREHIINRETIEVKDEDVENKIKEILDSVDEKYRDVYMNYYNSDEFKSNLRHELLADMVFVHLKEFAKIKEKKISSKE